MRRNEKLYVRMLSKYQSCFYLLLANFPANKCFSKKLQDTMMVRYRDWNVFRQKILHSIQESFLITKFKKK